MLRKYLVVVMWFPLTGILLLINLFLLFNKPTPQVSLKYSPLSDSSMQITASAGSGEVLQASIVGGDARGLLLRGFLKNYNSPMAPYADLIVQEADKNGFDYRLVVAIAMCESNLGIRMPSSDSYNAWGIAVYNGDPGEGRRFKSWPEAITWVSNYIKTAYYDKGIIDLHDIGAIWAPPSVEKGYSWTKCVQEFQKSIL